MPRCPTASLRVFANLAGTATPTTFIDISDRVGTSSGERGLFGIAFDAAFGDGGLYRIVGP